jgi:hypothetical protein
LDQKKQYAIFILIVIVKELSVRDTLTAIVAYNNQNVDIVKMIKIIFKHVSFKDQILKDVQIGFTGLIFLPFKIFIKTTKMILLY